MCSFDFWNICLQGFPRDRRHLLPWMFHSIWNNVICLTVFLLEWDTCPWLREIGLGGSEFTSAVGFRVASQAADVVHEKTSTYQFRQIPSPSPLFSFDNITLLWSSSTPPHSFANIRSRFLYLIPSKRVTPLPRSSICLESITSDVAKMRSQLLNTLAGALGLAALAASSPRPQAYVPVLEFPWEKMLILFSFGDFLNGISGSTYSQR
jgi:hypothetical protein